MMTRSVFAFLAGAAVLLGSAPSISNPSDVKRLSATIAAEARQLEAMASLQNLDFRTHQAQMASLRASINELGALLGAQPEGALADHAREAAALLSDAIEILSDAKVGILPQAYKETVRKLSQAAEQLLAEAKELKIARE